jgi:hypothetical protein
VVTLVGKQPVLVVGHLEILPLWFLDGYLIGIKILNDMKE